MLMIAYVSYARRPSNPGSGRVALPTFPGSRMSASRPNCLSPHPRLALAC